jgi:hypothetical protein
VADRLHRRDRVAKPKRDDVAFCRYLHLPDLVVLAIAGGVALEASTALLPVGHRILQTVVVIAWTAGAARRLVAWRHGKGRVLPVDDVPEMLLVAAGMTPWILLPLMRDPAGAWPLWAPLAFPGSLRVVGGCLAMAAVIGPFWTASGRGTTAALQRRAAVRTLNRPGLDACACAAGFFLLSASPVVGVLIVCWFGVVCCGGREPRAVAA